MFFSVLGSGSRGNCTYIESGSTAILIDAGFSGREVEARLRLIGRSLDRLNAIFVTHEHQDHIHGVGVLSRRCRIPVYCNDGTLRGGEKCLGKLFNYQGFETGSTLCVQDLCVRSFSVFHDAQDPVGFCVDNGKKTVACCTDTGKVSRLVQQRLKGCNALILEFNHDLEMLKEGPYSLALQQRVRSDHGHLSNDDAAAFLQTMIHDRLQWVVLGHLSATNNHPDLAMKAAIGAIGDSEVQVMVAGQDAATRLVQVE